MKKILLLTGKIGLGKKIHMHSSTHQAQSKFSDQHISKVTQIQLKILHNRG